MVPELIDGNEQCLALKQGSSVKVFICSLSQSSDCLWVGLHTDFSFCSLWHRCLHASSLYEC